jgi:hypothetical protein
MEQLPRDMLFVFRTNNMIRALNKDLGGSTQCVIGAHTGHSLSCTDASLCVSDDRDRFSIMGKYATQGHTRYYSSAAGSEHASSWSSVKYWWDHSNLVFRLRVLDYAMSLFRYWRGGEEPAKLKHVG